MDMTHWSSASSSELAVSVHKDKSTKSLSWLSQNINKMSLLHWQMRYGFLIFKFRLELLLLLSTEVESKVIHISQGLVGVDKNLCSSWTHSASYFSLDFSGLHLLCLTSCNPSLACVPLAWLTFRQQTQMGPEKFRIFQVLSLINTITPSIITPGYKGMPEKWLCWIA